MHEVIIPLIEATRIVYHSMSIQEQCEFMLEYRENKTDDVYIDEWLVSCSDAHWNYIKKIGTINRFIS